MKRLVVLAILVLGNYSYAGGLSSSFSGSGFPGPRQSTIFMSDGTIDSAGLLVDRSGSNEVTKSDLFNSWALTRATVTPNTYKDPLNNALLADTINEDNSAATDHYITSDNFTTVTNSTYTISVYAKKLNREWIRLTRGAAAVHAYFRLVGNGTVGATVSDASGTVVTSNIQKINTEWYRVSLTYKELAGAAIAMRVYVAEGDSDVTFDGLTQASFVLFGAQWVKNDDFAQGPGLYHATSSTVTKPRHDLTPSASAPTSGKVDLQGNDGIR